MRVRVHPLFFVLVLTLLVFGQALAFAWTFLALLLHEGGHALMARARGYAVRDMVLLPFGAMMSVNECFDKKSSVLVGLAGPMVNLALALALLALWWLFPACYPTTQLFFYSNLSLGLFNLLPAYPLDGSRVVLGLCAHRMKALRGLQIAGVLLSFVALSLFIASAFFKINFSLGIIAVFLFYGATSGSKDELYVSIMDSASKNYENGVQLKEVKISKTTPLARLYHHINSQSDTTFYVVDKNNKVEFTLTETELKEIAIKNKLSTSIENVVKHKISASTIDSISKNKPTANATLKELGASNENAVKNKKREVTLGTVSKNATSRIDNFIKPKN